MLADRPTRQSLVAQVDQERLEIRDDLLAWEKVCHSVESGYPLYSSGEPSYPWTRAVGGEDRGN